MPPQSETHRNPEHDRVRRDYRRVAPFYDLWAGLTESRVHARILDLAHVESGARVLDVAVGTGRLFRAMAGTSAGGLHVGVDLSWEMLSRARKAAPPGVRGGFAQASADALPFRSAAFDLVVNTYMLDLVPEQDVSAVLAEFARVLRPGGRLAVATMDFGDRWYHGFWVQVARRAPRLLTGCRPVRIAPALAAAGFAHVVSEPVSQNTFPSVVLVAERVAP